MSNPAPKTTIGFPTFIRLNITSTNLTEEKKTKALTVGQGITTENLQVSGNLNITNGGLECKHNLNVARNINVNPTSSSASMEFRGRVNLSNTPLNYKNGTSLRTDYENINGRADQQYVPFGEFKNTRVVYTERSATSGGWVGSGDFAAGKNLPWEKFDNQSYNTTDAVTFSSNNGQLNFTASSTQPKLLRISVFMTKDGRWLDNGTGGEVALEVTVNGTKKTLAVSTCSGQSNFRTRPMTWFCSTFYATSNGYFSLRNMGGTFRVRFFSWNVTVLPFIL
ncbi:hypothetical protein CpecG_0772 [Chlamydia pecorum MC/MarsBar]|uniref:Uncharacterized protein n=1 Tax=Chlamydia pecorum TaxID=85991 RepID=A0AA40U5V9_9CHLA|nr:hypothetical protein [Chlamydia pecorum]AGW38005.1 hypothetical protein CPE1_0513 [Chlamydia pecorum PV3056/3]ETF38088.1 hypothetical protein CpecF_0774 [Chlamydia pecorum DBDeUG]ETF38355.1 hypothetical protein CpecG_0772 [Chlamydia pecorum MC/MarsBar]ETF40324.1 hypothetical protein CpecA_0774 [Chlamydia pecorum IPTaLE]KTF28740.1 hypothetical protein cpL1_0776 [Chlamydia pecorum]